MFFLVDLKMIGVINNEIWIVSLDLVIIIGDIIYIVIYVDYKFL